MLRRFIESRERAHHAQDSNRHSLPFEWSLEHVGLPATQDPRTALLAYSQKAVADSDAFYSYTPTSQYEFDGHVLRFPSYVVTPYEANNTVYGRYFEAAGKGMQQSGRRVHPAHGVLGSTSSGVANRPGDSEAPSRPGA